MGRSDIRAITVKQPWAWAIAFAGKDIENRSAGSTYRGLLAVHAGLSFSARGSHDPRILASARRLDAPKIDRRELPMGAVIALAELVDVHPDAGCCRPWGESSYVETSGRRRTAVHHLVLEEIRPLPEPLPCRGALGLWRLPADVAALLPEGSVTSGA